MIDGVVMFKSPKLVKPLIYDFDIYVRAATEIQRHFRGYLSRKSTCGGSLKRLRKRVIII